MKRLLLVLLITVLAGAFVFAGGSQAPARGAAAATQDLTYEELVAAAQAEGLAGQRDVHPLGLQAGGQPGFVYPRRRLLQSGLHGGAHLVGKRPGGGTLLGRKRPHLFEDSRQLPLFAEQPDPYIFYFPGGTRVSDRRKRFFAQRFQILP